MEAKAANFQIKAERDCIFFGSSFAASWLSAAETRPAADRISAARLPANRADPTESLENGFSESGSSDPAIPLEALISEGALALKGQTCCIGQSKAPLKTLRRLTDFLSYLSGAATLAKCFTKDSRAPIFASPTQAHADSVTEGRNKSRTEKAPLSKPAGSSQSKPPGGGGKRSSKAKAPAAGFDRKEASQNQTAVHRSSSHSEATRLLFWEQKALLAGGAVLEPAPLKIFQDEESFLQVLNAGGEGGGLTKSGPGLSKTSAKPDERTGAQTSGRGGSVSGRPASFQFPSFESSAKTGEAEYFCFDKNGFSLSQIKALAAKLPEGAKVGIGGALTVRDCSRLPEAVFQFARPDLLQGRFPKAGMILTVL